ncbi:MAG: BlaI/MecI/CopY family transcriptional regulator [Naasia sp.]
MPGLGDLERSVMDVLWNSSEARSAYDVQNALAEDSDRPLAATTVLTVLSRLEKKGFVRRERTERPHRYSAVASREDHMAELMHEVLGGADDRTAVLARFVGQVSPAEAEALRRLLSKD